ncbi:hypothetical protein [Brevundimonas goettingensis]|uniref:Uncharacterized protein n=1 Tax=Brevundimonas goettingensis TaxID=2774190 RepID=A0A975C0Z7_9CAUL|nr:hypothetical protein [Brevundimonas goettingensis]QTC90902.1 hypothetical protein IFJ75_17000 [Brevundimonas goettingensis]
MSSTPNAPLILETTDTADSPVFADFFAGYEKAFVLPEEMEDEDGFRACLDLNHGAARQALEARYGLFREICLTARDPDDGGLVGGANLIAMPNGALNGVPVITANLNYVYVDGAQRGKGRFRALVHAISDHVAGMFPQALPEGTGARPLVFIEQNDPIAMDDDAYERDTRFTGMDQFDRLRVWSRAGALMVDMDYVQPPLSPDHPPVDTLILSVLGAGEARALPARLVRDHLARFFGISVLKGQPLERNETAARQLAELDALAWKDGAVRLIDLGPVLASPERPEAIRSRVGAGDGIGRRFRGTLTA